LEQFIEMQK